MTTAAPSRKRRNPNSRQGRSATASGPRISRADLLSTLGIVTLAFVAYLPVLRAGFVWDDIAVTENPVIGAADGLWRIWFDPRANVLEDHYWPLVYTSFWAEFRLWGLTAPAYHAVNVLIHAANSVLVWLLLRRMGARGAAFAGVLFAVHPIHVESVSWIIERKDLLSGMFYLLSAYTFLGFTAGRRRGLQAASVALLAAAMLCKSIAVTLPVALLLALWWRNGRITRRDLLDVAPLAAAAVIVATLDMWYLRTGGNEPLGLSLAERVVISGRAAWWYVARMMDPYPLMPIHPRWEATTAAVAWLWPASMIAALGLLFVLRARIGRAPFAALAFLVLTAAPVLGLVPHGFMRFSFVAERFAYLASIGVIALAAAGGAVLWDEARRADMRRGKHLLARIVLAGGAVVALEFATLTFGYCTVWRDSETLWSYAVRANPTAYEAHHQLAAALGQAGRIDEAIAAFEASLKLKPDYAEARANYALALEVKGDRTAALREAERAVRDKPGYGEGHNKLGAMLARSGRVAEAIPHFEEAVRIQPWNADALANLETARGQPVLPK
jgi:protein O-mannosyl-transferase